LRDNLPENVTDEQISKIDIALDDRGWEYDDTNNIITDDEGADDPYYTDADTHNRSWQGFCDDVDKIMVEMGIPL
jgi:hypothetical protein